MKLNGHLQPDPLENTMWQCFQDGRFAQVDCADQTSENRPPILFIHGLEYSSPSEAIRELVVPILSAMGPNKILDRKIYLFFWNGLILKDKKINESFCSSHFYILKFLLKHIPVCGSRLKEIEQRAKHSSQSLYTFAKSWLFGDKPGPIVITHSMGSLVWAEVINLALINSSAFKNPGVWWSMQPALVRSSLMKGGEYELVADLYRNDQNAQSMLWYSKLDLILSSIYWLAKKGPALGQFGCPSNSLPQRDITKWVKEAHGFNYLLTSLGPFTERIKHLIDHEASLLGI